MVYHGAIPRQASDQNGVRLTIGIHGILSYTPAAEVLRQWVAPVREKTGVGLADAVEP